MYARNALRPRHLLPFVAVLMLAGCDRPAPTALAAPGSDRARVSADHAANDGALPLRARADAVLLAQVYAPDFGPPLFGRSDFDGRCSVPSDFTLRLQLEGRATYLGAFTGTVEHCTQAIDPQAGLFTTSDGILTFTAANGDELRGTYAGTPAPDGGTNEMIVFAGGTGRFASASGEGIGHAVCDRQAGTCAFELDGMIAFDASDTR